jgi:hypothetical protein
LTNSIECARYLRPYVISLLPPYEVTSQ